MLFQIVKRWIGKVYKPHMSGFSECLTDADKQEAERTGSSLLYGEVLPEGMLLNVVFLLCFFKSLY